MKSMIDDHPLTVASDLSVQAAAVLMTQTGTGCLLVVDQHQLIGMVTERDVLRALAMQQFEHRIATIMDPAPVVLLETEAAIGSALKLLQQHQVQFLPVVDRSNQVRGLVSQSQLLQVLNLCCDEAADQHCLTQHRSLFHNLAEGIFQSTPDGQYLNVNATLASMHGYCSPEEMLASVKDIGQQLYVDPERRAEFIDLIEKHNIVRQFEVQTYRKDGSVIWVAENGWAVRDQQGKILYYEGSSIDITESKRKEAERKQIEADLREANEQLEHKVVQRTVELQSINEKLRQEMLEREQIEALNLLLATAIKHAGDAIEITDTEYKIVYANPALERMSGYSYSELIGKVSTQLLDDASIYSEIEAMLAINQTWRGYLTAQRKDGSLYEQEMTLSEVCNPDGMTTHYVAVKRDVTEQRRVEEVLRKSEERLRLVLQNMPVMLDVFDEQGNILVWNQECERVTGYRADEIIGNPDAMMMLYPDSADLNEIREEWREGYSDHRSWEWGITCKDGSVKTIAWSNVSEQFSIPGWYAWGIGIDVSERKKAEAEILKALAREKELSELKSEFISIVSHEFRTPLTTILSSTELLQKYGQQWTEEKQQIRYLRIIEAVERMTQLLNNVLLMGKAEAGKLQFNPAPLSVHAFCQELIEELRLSTGTKHTLQLIFTNDCRMPCLDAQLLRYMLTNLITNGIKYSPEGGAVLLRVVYDEQNIIFQIQDHGIGIATQNLEQLFDIFERGDNVGTISGTGLGLAIVKRCVDQHSGSIEIASNLNQGTQFTVKLPV